MAQTSGQNLPPPQSPFVDTPSRNLSYDGYQYLLSLLAIASSSQATATVSTGLTATGTNQATALQLNSQWNEVDSAVIGTGVLLSALQAGQSQVVINNAGVSIAVYPPPGGSIDGSPANAAVSLAPGSRLTFDFLTATQIIS